MAFFNRFSSKDLTGVVMKIILSILAFILYFSTIVYAQDIASWKTYTLKNNPMAKGLNLTFKYPPSFSKATVTKPGVIVEFSQKDPKIDYASYVTLAVMDLPPKFVDGMLKNTSGEWLLPLVKEFCGDIMKKLDGAKNFTQSVYKGNPVCDFNIIQRRVNLMNLHRQIKYRTIFYKYKYIGLQCGDSMTNWGDNRFSLTEREICNNFFASVELK
jgi:hypothetical protein